MHLSRAGNRRAFDKLGMHSSSLLLQDWVDLDLDIPLQCLSMPGIITLLDIDPPRKNVFFVSRVPPSVVY